jgi:hypothetical protein
MPPAASPGPEAEALADAADRGDAAALAALLPPLAPAPPQAALDAALLAAAGVRRYLVQPSLKLVGERDAAAALLLAAGASVDAVDEHGTMPLHLAAVYGDVPLIRRLLAAGARVDAPAGQGYPYCGAVPHHLAASYCRCEALALLLDSGGQVRPLLGGADGEGVHFGWHDVACCSLKPEHLRIARAHALAGGGCRRLRANRPARSRHRLLWL